MKVLRAIETGDFELLPQTYIKGFIRSYAQVVGLDPVGIVRKYETHLKATAAVLSGSRSIEKKSPRKIPWTVVGSVFCFLIVLIIFLLVVKREEEMSQIPVRHPEETVITQRSDSVLTTEADTLGTDTSALEQIEEELSHEDIGEEISGDEKMHPEVASGTERIELTLEALALSDTWVQVKADGDGIYEGIMRMGASATWKADSLFELKIGKAQGIRLELNDEPLGELGSPDKVVRSLILDKDGVVEKILR